MSKIKLLRKSFGKFLKDRQYRSNHGSTTKELSRVEARARDEKNRALAAQFFHETTSLYRARVR
jgi:hypothetical protein